MSDIVERLKAHVADIFDWNGRAMTNWDQWHAMIAAGDAGSEPRDCYESSIGAYAEDMQAAADEIERLRAALVSIRKETTRIRPSQNRIDAIYRLSTAALNPSPPSQPEGSPLEPFPR